MIEHKDKRRPILGLMLAAMVVCGLLAVAGGQRLFNRSASQTPAFALPVELFPDPTPTIYPSPVTVIEQVQLLGRLESVSYYIEKVVTAESGQGPLSFLLGDRLLLIARGTVIAGVDLSLVGPENVMITEEGTIYFRLPEAIIFIATLDNQRTEIYDRRTGLVGLNEQLETAARQEAELLIRQAAEEDGILEKADQNARRVMRSLFLALRLEQVIFVDEMPTPTPSPAPTITNTPEVAP